MDSPRVGGQPLRRGRGGLVADDSEGLPLGVGVGESPPDVVAEDVAPCLSKIARKTRGMIALTASGPSEDSDDMIEAAFLGESILVNRRCPGLFLLRRRGGFLGGRVGVGRVGFRVGRVGWRAWLLRWLRA
jgi:hypothetical protein